MDMDAIVIRKYYLRETEFDIVSNVINAFKKNSIFKTDP